MGHSLYLPPELEEYTWWGDAWVACVDVDAGDDDDAVGRGWQQVRCNGFWRIIAKEWLLLNSSCDLTQSIRMLSRYYKKGHQVSSSVPKCPRISSSVLNRPQASTNCPRKFFSDHNNKFIIAKLWLIKYVVGVWVCITLYNTIRCTISQPILKGRLQPTLTVQPTRILRALKGCFSPCI